MKTKEFIRKVENLCYQTEAFEFWIDVIDRFGLKGTVFTKDFKLALSTNDINLIKICLEYAETPLAEREEEKKYIVILPDPEDLLSTRHTLFRNDKGKISIGCTHVSIISLKQDFHLTEAEIKRNHEYLWQFAKEVSE